MHVAVNAFYWNRPDTGSGQYVHQLVRHLPHADPDLRLTMVVPAQITPHEPLPSGYRWHVAQAPVGHLGKLYFEQVLFPRACLSVRADLAHVPYWGSPLQSRIPVVVTVHDLIAMLLREYRGSPLARLYTGLVATAARGASQVITDSNASRSDIVAHLHIPAARVHTIYLAVEERFCPGPPSQAVVTKYRLPSSFVLYLGGYDRRKNVDGLVRAYGYVGPAIGNEFPLVLAGRLPQRATSRFPDLKRLIHELELEPFVHCIGFVEEEDKPDLYRSAAVAVQPSRYEGFGLTALEAMACGTPVVVSNSSSLPEVVGPAGFTVDPDDTRGIAAAIIACATQPALSMDLGRKGLHQAALFSGERFAHQTHTVYRQAMACHTNPAQ
jgi:glycosyltransferase involved in cell wall biosynthesis